MKHQITPKESAQAATPVWKRITAVFTLGSLVILGGILIAGVLSIALVALFLRISS